MDKKNGRNNEESDLKRKQGQWNVKEVGNTKGNQK